MHLLPLLFPHLCACEDRAARPQPVEASSTTLGAPPENVLLIVADDLGPQQLAAYGAQPDQPSTPTIDSLAAGGVRFDNAWAMPTCSPSRAALMTGRWPVRTGIGRWIAVDEDPWHLSPEEITLAELVHLSPLGYRAELIGKWHLAGWGDGPVPTFDPIDQGFDWFEGTLANLDIKALPDAGKRTYEHWEKDTNGSLALTDAYATTVTTDDALRRIATMPEPWLLVVTYNAPHEPFHKPPAKLHSSAIDHPCDLLPAACIIAAIEALDTELGRLLDGIAPDMRQRTNVLFLSDNGMPSVAIQPPFDTLRSKGTMFDGGVRVPLVVSGPRVEHPGSVSRALVSIVDLFPTIAAIAAVDPYDLRARPADLDPVAIDGHSLLDVIRDPTTPGARDTLFSQRFLANGAPPYTSFEAFTVRNASHKLTRYQTTGEQLYRYAQGALDEGPDLLPGPLGASDAAAYAQLGATLDAIVIGTPYGGP